jgi:hypothetical protein
VKVYLSGPISSYGDIKSNRKAFAIAEAAMQLLGHEVVNPFINCQGMPEDSTHADYMRRNIYAMLSCDAIYQLKHWTKSKGAHTEYKIARALSMEFIKPGGTAT